jgi:hypothetical protein
MVNGPDPRHASDDDARLAAVLGPARLAYFTPVHDQPILADRKAMFILGSSGLMVSVLLFFSQSLERLVRSGAPPASLAVVALVACVAALVLAAAVMAYRGYIRPLPPMPDTLAFFRSVAARGPREYQAAILSLDHPAALRGMLHYNYSVASQAAQKFHLVNRSLACLRVAIPLWMILLLVLAVWG